MKIYRVTMRLCEACLDGEGEECHTPECAMFLHSVDLPFHREFLEQCKYLYDSCIAANEFPFSKDATAIVLTSPKQK